MPWPSALPMWAPHSPETSMVRCKVGGATSAESGVGGVRKWARIWDHNEAPFSGPFFGPKNGPKHKVTQQCVTLIVASFWVRKTGSKLEPHCGTAFGPKWWHTVREKSAIDAAIWMESCVWEAPLAPKPTTGDPGRSAGRAFRGPNMAL